MASKNITINRYDSSLNNGSGGWVKTLPRTLASNVYAGYSDEIGFMLPLVNDDGKIDTRFIPDWISSGSKYAGTISGTANNGVYSASLSISDILGYFYTYDSEGDKWSSKDAFPTGIDGAYLIIGFNMTLTFPSSYTGENGIILSQDNGNNFKLTAVYLADGNDVQNVSSAKTLNLHSGDMLIFRQNISESPEGYDGLVTFTASVISNVYEHADTSEYGLVKLAGWSSGSVTGDNNNVITKTVLNDFSATKQNLNTNLTRLSSMSTTGLSNSTAHFVKFLVDSQGNISASLDSNTYLLDSNASIVTTEGSETITVKSNTLNVVTRNTNQTISGNKSFTGTFSSNSIYPNETATYDLGSSSKKWRYIYLYGSLTDGTNSMSVADMSKIYYQSSAPSSPKNGDIWLQFAS